MSWVKRWSEAMDFLLRKKLLKTFFPRQIFLLFYQRKYSQSLKEIHIFAPYSWEDIIFDGHLTQTLVLLILSELYHICKITKYFNVCEILINYLQKGRRMRNSTPFSGCSSHRDQSSQSVLRGNLAHTQRSIFFVLSFLLYVTLDGEPLCNLYNMG